MIKNLILGLTVCLAILSYPLNAGGGEQSIVRSGDVYAFMPFFVFDTKRGVFINRKRGKSYSLRDCSTTESVCLVSDEFRFEFPRNCSEREKFLSSKDSFGQKRLSLERRTHYSRETLSLLTNPEYPSYGLLVGHNGIGALIYNPMKPVLEVADLDSIVQAFDGKPSEFAFGEIVSVPRFEACERI